MSFINLAHAEEGHITLAKNLRDQINEYIVFPLLAILLAAAVMVFIWGAFQYIVRSDDSSARAEGQKHMFYGIIGIVVMVSALAILQIALKSVFGNSVNVP